MAVTGLILFGFVIVHMLGNLQIFLGQEALNAYAEHLEDFGALLWIARGILLTALVAHMISALSLAIENKNARPIPYAVQDTVQASFASRTMVMTGLIIFAFVIFHLAHLTFGKIHPEVYSLMDAKGRHDLYSVVILGFQDYRVAGTYVLAMFFLCLHLSHGISSLFQSLGLNNVKTQPVFKTAAKLIALLIFIGNCSIPMASLFGVLKPAGGF